MPVLEVVTFVAAPPEQVFDCARDVTLHLRSMARRRERVLEGRAEGLLEIGERVTWASWHFGMPWSMTVKVTGFERPRWFQGQMISGPFATFTHDHHFTATADGTRMYDVIAYRAPGGVAARVVAGTTIHDHLSALIRERAAAIRAAAEGAPART